MSDPLLARVLDGAPATPFVSLVHWLERLIGSELDGAGRGPIALRHHPGLGFHASDLAAHLRDDVPGVAVVTAFAGLTGTVSPLPTPALEGLACDDERELAEHVLLDVFHHRLLSLLYRGLRAHDPARDGDEAPALDWLLALAGLPVEARACAAHLPRAVLLRLVPLLVAHPPTATRLRMALREVLGDLLGDAEVRIVPLCGGSVPLAPAQRPRLGVDLRLGARSTLGAHCPAPASAVAVEMSGLAHDALLAMRPGGTCAALLEDVVRMLVPESITVTITLRAVTRPPARLTEARLCSTWLGRGGHTAPATHVLA